MKLRPRATPRFVARAGLLAVLWLCAVLQTLSAADRDPFIEELMAGANGDARIQFIVINQDSTGQNLWGPNGAAQSRAMLVFYDGAGRQTGVYKFPANPPTGGSLRTLIATAEFAALPGAPTPDLIMPPFVIADSGQVCFRTNPANAQFTRNECVSYGQFRGDTGNNVGDRDGTTFAGSPAASYGLPITDTVSLRRSQDRGLNEDFALTTSPTPMNIAGATFTMPVASPIAQGNALFTVEKFLGNGRTCATCHNPAESYRLTPSSVVARVAAAATTFDPLLVGERKPSDFDAGVDGNVNILGLMADITSGAPCLGSLRGVITTPNGARATVLTSRSSSRSYLIHGGKQPQLAGIVSDTHGCSGVVLGVTSGDLAADPGAPNLGLEVPARMRTTVDTNLPDGRALVLVNPDGFSEPAVFRKAPYLLNLRYTAPYGFSNDIPDLRTFSARHVAQHFPRTLDRTTDGPSQDFRAPTDIELDYLEVFLLAQEFPAGNDPNKYDLDRFATTSMQRDGRFTFGGAGRCAQCHGGLVMATMPYSAHGEPAGANGTLNTGVYKIAINTPSYDNLRELNGTREFAVPQLWNIRNLGPYFHDNSVRTLADVMDFYGSNTTFNYYTYHLAQLDRQTIAAFLESLSVRPYTLTGGPLRFGLQAPDAGPTAPLNITITNTSGSPLTFGESPCVLTGRHTAYFAIASCPLTSPLAPGESRVIEVVFDPPPGFGGIKQGILEVAPTGVVPSGVDLFGATDSLFLPPTISTSSHYCGWTTGGTTLTITGKGFQPTNPGVGTAVTVGGALAGMLVNTGNTLTFQTGPHEAGIVSIEVTLPAGQTATLENSFTYVEAVTFTDNPLNNRKSIKAIHITELRAAIDRFRLARNLAAVNWTDASLAGTTVRAVHITELQTAISEVYAADGRTTQPFSAVTAGVGIRFEHIVEIRVAITDLC